MCSYNVEQARGDQHNLIPVVIHELGVDVHGAMQWIEKCYNYTIDRCLRVYYGLPWKKDTHPEIFEYVNGVMNWARANDSWSFESRRYFGDSGMEIMKSRVVELLPRLT